MAIKSHFLFDETLGQFFRNLYNSNVLIAIRSTSVMTRALTLFFKK